MGTAMALVSGVKGRDILMERVRALLTLDGSTIKWATTNVVHGETRDGLDVYCKSTEKGRSTSVEIRGGSALKVSQAMVDLMEGIE